MPLQALESLPLQAQITWDLRKPIYNNMRRLSINAHQKLRTLHLHVLKPQGGPCASEGRVPLASVLQRSAWSWETLLTGLCVGECAFKEKEKGKQIFPVHLQVLKQRLLPEQRRVVKAQDVWQPSVSPFLPKTNQNVLREWKAFSFLPIVVPWLLWWFVKY